VSAPVPERLLTPAQVAQLFRVDPKTVTCWAFKLAPEGYLSAAKALGVPAERCVVIEDAPSGVRAGPVAGMRVIGVRGGGIGNGDGVQFVTPALTGLQVDTAGDDMGSPRISLAARR
jgi:sugar-phosphatase